MKAFVPMLTKLKSRKVLTITTVGNPNTVAAAAMQSLYGTAYGTKFKVFKPLGKKMDIGHCSAFWPDAHLQPKSKWTGVWNLEVPTFVKVKDLIQKNPKLPVRLIKLPAGTYAQVLYVGPYTGEAKTIQALHKFIQEHKAKIAGAHEEVYLSRPGPKAKTVIQYLVKK